MPELNDAQIRGAGPQVTSGELSSCELHLTFTTGVHYIVATQPLLLLLIYKSINGNII